MNCVSPRLQHNTPLRFQACTELPASAPEAKNEPPVTKQKENSLTKAGYRLSTGGAIGMMASVLLAIATHGYESRQLLEYPYPHKNKKAVATHSYKPYYAVGFGASLLAFITGAVGLRIGRRFEDSESPTSKDLPSKTPV